MMSKEIEFVKERAISCQGLEAPYDHPLIYLEIKDGIDKIDCPYCGKEFIYKE